MPDVMLTASMRNNLLSLNETQKLIDRTNYRLTSGLEISSAVDDAVRYFQSKGLQDRANDLGDRKLQIEQGVQTLTVAFNALAEVEKVLQSIKSLVTQARNGSPTERADHSKMLAENVRQLNNLMNDPHYTGLNLLNSSASLLRVQFSDRATSDMKVPGVDFTSTGTLYRNSLGITVYDKATLVSRNVINPGPNGSRVLYYLGFLDTISHLNPARTVNASLNSKGWFPQRVGTGLSEFKFSVNSDKTDFIRRADISTNRLDATINAVKAQTAKLGNFLSIMKIRVNFTENYANTLKVGGTELVIADKTLEQTNLLALDTRQQLGIQALSFAGQSEKSILQLFRG